MAKRPTRAELPYVGRDPALGPQGPTANEIFGNMPLERYNDNGHPVDGSNPSISMPSFPPTK